MENVSNNILISVTRATATYRFTWLVNTVQRTYTMNPMVISTNLKQKETFKIICLGTYASKDKIEIIR